MHFIFKLFQNICCRIKVANYAALSILVVMRETEQIKHYEDIINGS